LRFFDTPFFAVMFASVLPATPRRVVGRGWIVAALAIAVTGGVPARAAAQTADSELDHWMAFVDDAARLGDLTIPGTHDSGALFESFPGTAICQDMSIANQLDIGVRYLDIRLRQIGNALVVHHGAVYQHENFDDVLIQVTGFLRANPSETVIMEVSSEHTPADNTESYEQTFMRYVNHPSYRDAWWRERRISRLGEVRGKIVLLRRFSGSASVAGGIDVTGWRDNTQFTLTDAAGVRITVQDSYVVSSNGTKWSAITGLLGQAAGDTGGAWYVNFTSGYWSILGIPNILGVSGDINRRLLDYATTSTLHHAHHGTVVSDFVARPIVQQLLRLYFE